MIIAKYGGSFVQSKPSQPLVFAETEDSVLYFANDKRFMEWAAKRFKYEDNTRIIFYKRVANKAHQAVKEKTRRSYCSIALAIGDDPAENVVIELFDEECPDLAKKLPRQSCEAEVRRALAASHQGRSLGPDGRHRRQLWSKLGGRERWLHR
jgi:hypothetical protein